MPKVGGGKGIRYQVNVGARARGRGFHMSNPEKAGTAGWFPCAQGSKANLVTWVEAPYLGGHWPGVDIQCALCSNFPWQWDVE